MEIMSNLTRDGGGGDAEARTEPRNTPSLALASPSQKRPSQLGEMGTPTRSRRHLFDLPGTNLTPPKTPDNNVIERKMKEIMKLSGILLINGVKYQTEMKDLEDMGELGNGTSGHVVKMLHKPSQEVIAVKQMRRSGNMEENKRIAMDLDVVLKSHDCPYIVQCLGCFITDAEVWICMELMSTCFDKLLKRLGKPMPEPILGKITLATVRALSYLKDNHGVIHRDVKPSNILLDDRGHVKLCDFGISGHLVNSKANTKNAGCTAYLAPERINPPDPRKPDYDIRADVWSLGITLVEMATGTFPYPSCKSDFEVLSRVLQDDPPSLPDNGQFSPEFRDFVKACLAKDYHKRPKYAELLKHSFLRRFSEENVDVALWFARATILQPFSPRHRKVECEKPEEVVVGVVEPAPQPHQVGTHQRSLSEVGAAGPSPYLEDPRTRFSPFRGLVGSPLVCRKRVTGDGGPGIYSNNTSPLLLQRFYHQQSQHFNPHHRSASVSPIRQYTGGVKGSVVGENSGRKKLSSYFKFHLGGGGGGSPPEPPPRHNRTASPLLLRRLTPEPVASARRNYPESSPTLSRRYVSPSPPQPPPRRLSESGSVPGSPFHHHHHPPPLAAGPHSRHT